MNVNSSGKKLQVVVRTPLGTRSISWEQYKVAQAEFRMSIPEDAYIKDCGQIPSRLNAQWLKETRLHGITIMRKYLGVKSIRSYSREPKVFTLDYMEKLRAQNLAERTYREPHFVKMASLYEQINQLDA